MPSPTYIATHAADAQALLTEAYRKDRPVVSSAAFSPSAIAGLKAWFRADLGVTGTTTVTNWVDQAGSSNATASGGTEPSLNSANASLNNQPTITFSGSRKIRTSAWGAALTQALTVVVVAQAVAGTKYLVDNLTDPPQCAVYSAGAAVNAFAGSGISIGGDLTLASIVIVEFNGASTKIYRNARTALTTNNAGANGLTGLSIGNYAAGGSFAGSDIAEVIVYSGIDASARANIWNYASARYGISVGA